MSSKYASNSIDQGDFNIRVEEDPTDRGGNANGDRGEDGWGDPRAMTGVYSASVK